MQKRAVGTEGVLSTRSNRGQGREERIRSVTGTFFPEGQVTFTKIMEYMKGAGWGLGRGADLRAVQLLLQLHLPLPERADRLRAVQHHLGAWFDRGS